MICVASLGKCCNTCKIKGNLQNKIPPNVLQNRILFSLLSFIPVSLSSSFNPTHPDISPFLQIISKYTLLQTLPDLITILSCMSLLFLFPSSSLSHCLSPSSDYLISLSLSLFPLSLEHFLAHKSWKLRSEGWCCWKPRYKATTLSQMKTLLWHGEAGEHPVHIPPYVSASGSSILFTCVHGCYLGSNTDETCRVVISELRGVYTQYINIYIYTACFTADSILEYCRAGLGKCFLPEKNNLNTDWTFAFTFWFLLIFHSSVVSPHGSG